MSRAPIIAALFWLLVPDALIAASDPPVLRVPSSKWNVDYGESACLASRKYGTAEDSLTLAFRPSPNDTVTRLMIVRAGHPAPRFFSVKISFGSTTLRTSGLQFSTEDKKLEIIWINLKQADLLGLERSEEIAITGGAIRERLAISGVGAVLKSLDACNVDLRAYWNLAPTGQAQLSRLAEPLKPLRTYFSPADYPADAARNGNEGATRVVMMIDESGAAKDCMVEETSGFASLDAMACFALRRARFRPALDTAEKPVRSVLTQQIRWSME